MTALFIYIYFFSCTVLLQHYKCREITRKRKSLIVTANPSANTSSLPQPQGSTAPLHQPGLNEMLLVPAVSVVLTYKQEPNKFNYSQTLRMRSRVFIMVITGLG